MYIITAKIEKDKTAELIVNSGESLFAIANYFERNKTEFKVSSSMGRIVPELFGWDPLDNWKYWITSLWEK